MVNSIDLRYAGTQLHILQLACVNMLSRQKDD